MTSNGCLLALAASFIVYRAMELAFGVGFKPPMPIGEFLYYLRFEPLWTGIVGFVMQYIYYTIEFVLAALIVDCVQKTSIKMGWAQRIPWGGILLALTWRLTHPSIGLFVSGSQISLYSVLFGLLLSLTAGFAYMLPCKKNIKPIYAFLVVMVFYWL